MKTPRSVDLAITSRCNLKCAYCSHFSSPTEIHQDLPAGEWLTFFEELGRCAVMTVTIGGGEPFFRDDLKTLIQGIIDNRMRFNILSNGTLITEDMAAFLSSTGRCNGVQVSIDGSVATTHDAFRGKGNFKKAIDGINILKKYGAPVSVRVTIHKKNVYELESIAAFLLEDIGLPSFSTNSASYMGLCRQNTDQVQLSVKEHSHAMSTLIKLNKKYNGRISATAGPLADGMGWINMLKAIQKGQRNNPRYGYLTGCGGMTSKIAVRADGVMVPCVQLSHIELGRILHDDLKEVWQQHPELKRLRDRHNIPLSDFEFCQGCEYINLCTGNCPALAYTITGKDNHPSPDACLKRFLEQGGKLPDIEPLVKTDMLRRKK